MKKKIAKSLETEREVHFSEMKNKKKVICVIIIITLIGILAINMVNIIQVLNKIFDIDIKQESEI